MLAGREFLQWWKVVTFVDFVALFIVVVGVCIVVAIKSIFSQWGSRGGAAIVPRWQGPPVHRLFWEWRRGRLFCLWSRQQPQQSQKK